MKQALLVAAVTILLAGCPKSSTTPTVSLTWGDANNSSPVCPSTVQGCIVNYVVTVPSSPPVILANLSANAVLEKSGGYAYVLTSAQVQQLQSAGVTEDVQVVINGYDLKGNLVSSQPAVKAMTIP